MKIILSMMLILSVATINVIACENGFLPPNDLYIPVGIKSEGGISQDQFNAVIDKVEKIYSSRVLWKLQKLSIIRKWDDGTVNAFAFRVGPFRQVLMYGGLARHSKMTRDGFAMVLCHELGHHLGGAPKNKSVPVIGGLTNEGQSDYFAALKCMREFLQDEDNEGFVAKTDIPSSVKDKCESAHNRKFDSSICIRTVMASTSVLDMMVSLGGRPYDLDLFDQDQVISTRHKHPDSQCRMDTFLAGSICEVNYKEDVDQKDETVGTCNESTGHKTGLRPRCWFAPEK